MCTDNSQAKFFALRELPQRVAQSIEMLHGAEASSPTNHDWLRISGTFDHLILIEIDRGRNHRHVRIELARVLCQIGIANHDVRRQPANCAGLRRKLEIAEISIRRAAIRNEDRVIEIKDERDSPSDHPFEERRPK